jgi:hypothetical protein
MPQFLSIPSVVVAMSAAGPPPAADATLSKQAFDGYKMLIDSIDTFECRSSFTSTGGGQNVAGTASYVRRGDAEKYAVEYGNGRTVQFARSGVAVKLVAPTPDGRGAGRYASISAYNMQSLGDQDPWKAMGFRGFEFRRSLIEKLKPEKRFEGFKAARSDALGGANRGGIVVTQVLGTVGNPSGYQHTSDFDIAYNYLVTRDETRLSTPSSDTTTVVAYRGVREVSPAVYVPLESETTIRDAKTGVVRKTIVVKLTGVKANHALPAAAVELKFPKGITVHDGIRNVDYETGDDGGPAGPVRPAARPNLVTP